MTWALEKKIDLCAKHKSCTYNKKAPLGMQNYCAPNGAIIMLKIGTFDLAFAFT